MTACINTVFLMFNCVCVLDPYGRSPPFTPLGALGSGAFGGLGSPTLGRSHSISTLETRGLKDRMIFISSLSQYNPHIFLMYVE